MNHDYAHCLDYDVKACPKTCFRAELTEDLRRIQYPLRTSWSHFKGTSICPIKTKAKGANNERN